MSLIRPGLDDKPITKPITVGVTWYYDNPNQHFDINVNGKNVIQTYNDWKNRPLAPTDFGQQLFDKLNQNQGGGDNDGGNNGGGDNGGGIGGGVGGDDDGDNQPPEPSPTPPTPPGQIIGGGSSQGVTSHDPNAEYGPAGYGPQGFISDSSNPLPYQVDFENDPTDTSAAYTGQPGHTYGFYCIATDNVGNQEVKTPVAEAITQVQNPAPTWTFDGSTQLTFTNNLPQRQSGGRHHLRGRRRPLRPARRLALTSAATSPARAPIPRPSTSR